MKATIVLALLAVVVLVHTVESSAPDTKPSAVRAAVQCNRRDTARIIRRAMQKVFCNSRKNKTKFINWFFNKYSKNGFLPRSAFKLRLRQELPQGATKLRRKMRNLRKRCVGKFKRWLGRKNNKVSKKEFKKYFFKRLSRKRCRGRGKGRGRKSNKKCSKKQTGRVIKKAFIRLYCYRRWRRRKNGKKTLKPRRFLRWYFKKYSNKKGFLPRNAFKKNLRRAFPNRKSFRSIRKSLLNLRRSCVKQFKQWLGRKNNKVSRREFVRYYLPILSKKNVCGRRRKSSNPKKVPTPSTSSSSSAGTSRAIPYCPPGYYKKKAAKERKCFLLTARLVIKGFRRYYCHRKWSNKSLKPGKFLRWYFRKNKTKNGYLPKEALRRRLKRRLPKCVKKLRNRIGRIRTKCLKKFKNYLNADKNPKVSKWEFVRFFKRYLSKDGLCERYWAKYPKYY